MNRCLLWCLLALPLGACAAWHHAEGGQPEGESPPDVEPPVEEPAALAAACRFDAPADPDAFVMAAVRGDEVILVRGDGQQVVADRFAVPGNFASWAKVQARGDYIAAQLSWYAPDWQPSPPDGASGHELVLLDRKGTVRWHKVFGARELTPPEPGPNAELRWQLGEEGRVAISFWPITNLNRTFILDADGNEREVADVMPLMGAASDGALPVRRRLLDNTSHFELGWVRAGADVVEPAAFAQRMVDESQLVPRLIRDRLVYVAQREGAPVLVSERPGDAQVLAELPRGSAEYYRILDASDDAVLLSRTGSSEQQTFDAAQLVRVDLADSRVEMLGLPSSGGLRPVFVSLETPPPFLMYDAPGHGLRLDLRGELIAPLRDAAGAALHRTSDGASWQRLGDRMSGLVDVMFLSRGGAYLVTGRDWSEWDSPFAPEENGPVDHVGSVLQVVARDGRTQVLADADKPWEFADVQLSSDGRCALYTEAAGLHVLDIELARSHVLFASEPPPYDALAWIEQSAR